MSKNSQKKLRNKKFSFDQYWNIHYTEVLDNGAERDYKSIIKSRSADLAKEILIKKIKEDNPTHKIKSVQIYMFSSKSYLDGLQLNIEDWEHIRLASFPNIANCLFKCYIARPEGYSNRFNKSAPNHPRLFKKGNKQSPHHKNKLTKTEKAHKLFKNGKWIPWAHSEREALKEKIILALNSFNNNRSASAKFLKINPRSLYSLMHDKFIEIDWNKEYPPPKPDISNFGKDYLKKLNLGRALKSKAFYKKIKPKVLSLHHKGLSMSQIRSRLGHSYKTIKNCIENDK